MAEITCYRCGACCIAYDISTLQKPAGIKCIHLGSDMKCREYNSRPEVCRKFKADALCVMLSALPLREKLKIIAGVYT